MGLVSYIPPQHREKAAIDSAVRALLASLTDSWDVLIKPATTVRWWIVTMVRRRDGYTWPFFVDARQQTAAGVIEAISEVVRLAT
jgi:hypothetical protein